MIRDNLVGTVAAPLDRHRAHGHPLMEAQCAADRNLGRKQPVGAFELAFLPASLLDQDRTSGNLVTTYTSQDGASWGLGSPGISQPPATVNMGLFVCSGNTNVTTATFEHVAFTDGTGG
jgi:hypothetical protein